MTPLRQRMIEDMRIRNFATTTQRSYVHYVAEFAKYFNRSPQELDLEAVRQYQLYLAQERKLSPQSIKYLRLSGAVPVPHHPGDALGQARLPARPFGTETSSRLAPDEVQQFLDHVPGVKHCAVLLTCDGAGLRISEEWSAPNSSDVDSKRMLLRVEHGKGAKDRYAMLSPCLLQVLRAYWRILRPAGPWLFPSWRPHLHLSAGAVQTACREAWQCSGLAKRVTPHMLRHYAGFRTIPGDGVWADWR